MKMLMVPLSCVLFYSALWNAKKHEYPKECGESVICITKDGAITNPEWTVQRVMIDQEHHTITGYQDCKPSEDIFVYLRGDR